MGVRRPTPPLHRAGRLGESAGAASMGRPLRDAEGGMGHHNSALGPRASRRGASGDGRGFARSSPEESGARPPSCVPRLRSIGSFCGITMYARASSTLAAWSNDDAHAALRGGAPDVEAHPVKGKTGAAGAHAAPRRDRARSGSRARAQREFDLRPARRTPAARRFREHARAPARRHGPASLRCRRERRVLT